MSGPIITPEWRGGNRIKIDRVAAFPGDQWRPARPAATRFRVFAGQSIATRTRRVNSLYVMLSGIHSGPKSERTILVPDDDGKPNFQGIAATIAQLHRRWIDLWFYDASGLGLGAVMSHMAETDAPLDDSLDDL